MKTNFTNFYTFLFSVAILLATASCSNEQLDLSLDANGSLANRGGPKTTEFDECPFAADEVKLIAGQFTEVGKVTVEEIDGGENYKITFTITNNEYCLTETHLSVVNLKSDFPLSKGGNPKNGKFEYSGSHDCELSVEYIVPTADGPYIAAHAVVNCISDVTTDAYAETLPNEVDVCVTAKGLDAVDSYFNITIGPENDLTGDYDAWCVDQDTSLNDQECFTGDVYSSYETLPDGKFENPQNFGAVNWLINQGFIGTEATPALGNYTFGDIQMAIWNLVDDSVCSECLFIGPYDNDRIDMLVALALENTSFVPACGDEIVIIIVPQDDKQSIFITIPAPCECEETAWGAANGEGCEFPGNNWATYFQYPSN